MMATATDLERMRDYCLGRLSDQERGVFEDRLVREPQLVHELEQFVRLREGLHSLRAQGYFRKGAQARVGLRRWQPMLAAAAAAAGLAVLLWAYSGTQASPVLMAALEGGPMGDAAASVAGHFTFVPVRGYSNPVLALPRSGLIEFRTAPAVRLPHYRLTLTRQLEAGTSEFVGTLGGLSFSADGYVHGFAEASRLTEGSYVLRIAPDPESAGAAESFLFTLRAAPETQQ